MHAAIATHVTRIVNGDVQSSGFVALSTIASDRTRTRGSAMSFCKSAAMPVVRRLAASTVLAGSMLICNVAAAVAPAISTAPLTIGIPESGQSVGINLRQLGVITGSAPITITSALLLLNGQPNPGELAADILGSALPGQVCVTITNGDFDPASAQVLTLRLSAINLKQQSVGPVNIPLVIGAAPTGNLATCGDPNTSPVANGGQDRTIQDTDSIAGESVVLDASASTDADLGSVLTYEWRNAAGAALAAASTTSQLTTRLPNGVNVLTLVVTDDSGDTQTDIATDTVTITVNDVSTLPVVNAGADRVIPDTDREPGENVALSGGATAPAGTIQLFQWSLGEQVLGAGATLQTRLPDGVNTVTLRATNSLGQIALDTVQITVGVAAPRVALADLPNLSPTGKSVASALDRVCSSLDTLATADGPGLTSDQQALRARCDGLYFNNTVGNQVQAIEELVADDFAVARTQTLLFANTQYASVMDRLMALRGGARGLSLAGLSIIVDGKRVPLAQIQDIVKQMLGGGASSDADEAGGLLSDKWGMWVRGNYSFGKKDANAASPSFDANQWSMVGGLDYRLSDRAVLGGSLAYGKSNVDFSMNAGALDSESWAGSVYGSIYAGKNFYVDGIFNVADAGYDAERNIAYVDGTGLINRDAKGATDGMTLSGGVSGGYDFLFGGVTLSPTIGIYYIDATIDSFTETGAVGLNLRYDEQKFQSLTGNLGFRATYAMNLNWGVLLPHVRIDYVREFENDVDVFGVRFAADPNANSAPPILVTSERPDESYWRLAAGVSAQFKFGFSGYMEYQRLQSFDFISFQDVSVGLRMQRSF
jgi:outer membrane autotransporter protein